MKCNSIIFRNTFNVFFFILHNRFTEKSKTLISAISIKITIISIYWLKKYQRFYFLPVNMVNDAWNNLKIEFTNDEIEQQLVSYFEENCILGKIKMRCRNNRTPKDMNLYSLLKRGLYL